MRHLDVRCANSPLGARTQRSARELAVGCANLPLGPCFNSGKCSTETPAVDTSNIRKGDGLNKADFVKQHAKALTEHYEIQKELGRGSFGIVFAVKHRTTKQEAVCKNILKEKCGDVGLVRNEIALLRTLDHPHIVLPLLD